MTRVITQTTQQVEEQTTGSIERLLNEAEVATRQGRALKTLRNQRVTGDGIPYLKLGRSVRYRLSDVLAWEDARRRNSTTDHA